VEEISQLYNQNLLLSERVLQLELQLSVMQVQLKEHAHRYVDFPSGEQRLIDEAVLFQEQQLEDPLPDEPESFDGLD
jgi:hypothetical protein